MKKKACVECIGIGITVGITKPQGASKMKKLQVKLNGKWEYVFCRNPLFKDPITTESQVASLGAQAMSYFKDCYGNHEFRLGDNTE